MNPYNCISLEHRVGMIQVVLNAETIANIQKEKGVALVSCFKKDSILSKFHVQQQPILQPFFCV